ncbi:MAG: alpha/beta hydrolase [Geminicoccaceae bacterium]
MSFDAADSEPAASLYFCRRLGAGQYEEVLAPAFFSRLRRSSRRQILLFIHGFNCQPEAKVFPAALELQRLCDGLQPDLVEVVPLVWPCDDDFGLVLDYWDDQAAAEMSGQAFARMIGKFVDWRERAAGEELCLKHVSVLAHSMGNRVLRSAFGRWQSDYGAIPAAFRALFLVAPDLANDGLEPDGEAAVLPATARHVVVYHAADDFALRSSKVANLRHKLVSRRLGHSGPCRPERTPGNVVAVDCDEVNGLADPLGHSYFLGDGRGRPGAVLRHVVATLAGGRVPGCEGGRRQLVLSPEASAVVDSAA